MKIEELDLSVRSYNVLKRARIDTVEQLQQLSDEDLMRFRNMGRHSLEEIREKVAFVKTMTNADRIRAMSDEQLAERIAGLFEDQRVGIEYSDDAGCWLHWLKQPAEEVHHG